MTGRVPPALGPTCWWGGGGTLLSPLYWLLDTGLRTQRCSRLLQTVLVPQLAQGHPAVALTPSQTGAQRWADTQGVWKPQLGWACCPWAEGCTRSRCPGKTVRAAGTGQLPPSSSTAPAQGALCSREKARERAHTRHWRPGRQRGSPCGQLKTEEFSASSSGSYESKRAGPTSPGLGPPLLVFQLPGPDHAGVRWL